MAGVGPQRGGSNATTIGMVVSIVVSVLLVGVLVWLITQQEGLRTTAEQANQAKQRISDENRELSRSTQLLAGRISGNQNDTAQVAVGKLDAILEKIASDKKTAHPEKFTSTVGSVAIVETLASALADEQTAREKAESDRDRAAADLVTANKTNADMRKNFGSDLQKLGAKVAEMQTAKSDFEKLKNTELETLSTQIGSKQDELNSMRQDRVKLGQLYRTQLEKNERVMHEQREALKDLRGPGAAGAQELAIARKPVGTVMRALPGNSLVNIDLGKRDNVTLGMTFSVYSNDQRVPSDGRGKAKLEVQSVGPSTAECTVTSPPSPDDPILEGDKVGNIVLSRDRGKKQRFCIVGRFDVDYDGQEDAKGAEVIKSLVTRYGGIVVDHVDASTDYLVVGMEPPGGSSVAATVAPTVKPAAPAAKPAGKAAAKGAKGAKKEDSGDEAEEGGDEDKDKDKASGGDEKKSGDDAEKEESSDDEEGGDKPAAKAPAKKPGAAAPTPAPTTATPSAPAANRLSPVEPVDVTSGPRDRRTMTEREQYDDAIMTADRLAIPRLPQDRFFNFVGIEPGPKAAKHLPLQ